MRSQLPGVISSTPTPSITVRGLTGDDNDDLFGFQVVPPDTNGDIGLNEAGQRIYVQYINLVWSVFDANNGSRLHGPFAGNTFWTGFGGPCENNNDGDSLVLFDHLAGRWVFSQFSIDEGTQCLAVSTTSDPLGPYYRYAFVVTPGGANDYPKIGVWSDGTSGSAGQSAYTLTTRDFSAGVFFAGMGATVLQRDAILNGEAASFVKFSNPCVGGECMDGQLPPHLEGPPPPAGTCPTFWSAVDTSFDQSPHASDGYRNHTLCADWFTPGASTYTEGPLVAAGSNFDRSLGGGYSDCISPVKDSLALDCLAAWTMYRAQYRWFDDHASVVLNTTVDAGMERAGIRWAEVSSVDGQTSWFREQDGTYAPDDGLERWMGSIAQDADGNIALGYSVAGADLFPSVRYTSRLSSDPPGMLAGGEVSCHEGTGGQGGVSRWGDYSSMSVDPVDNCTFWYTQEYKETTSGFDFDTRICSFRLPECAAPDLVVIEPGVDNPSPEAGEPFTLNATVQNAGTGASDSTTLRYLLSTDPVITSDDLEMATDTIAGLEPGAISPQGEVVSVPTADTWWVGACVNEVAGESNTTNQCSMGVEINAQEPEPPDLIVLGAGVDNPTPEADEPFTLSVIVQNVGTGASNATTLTYRLSTNPVITSSDVRIGTDAVMALEPGAASPQSELVTVPHAGIRWVGACVDAVAGELDITNQCSSGVQIDVPQGDSIHGDGYEGESQVRIGRAQPKNFLSTPD